MSAYKEGIDQEHAAHCGQLSWRNIVGNNLIGQLNPTDHLWDHTDGKLREGTHPFKFTEIAQITPQSRMARDPNDAKSLIELRHEEEVAVVMGDRGTCTRCTDVTIAVGSGTNIR